MKMIMNKWLFLSVLAIATATIFVATATVNGYVAVPMIMIWLFSIAMIVHDTENQNKK